MINLKAIQAGAIGTTFMTLFSYGYSRIKKKQFREPVLLAHLLSGPKEQFRQDELLKGWLAPYMVGAVFSLTYQQIFQGRFNGAPAFKGMVMGGMYGLLGVVGWRSAFKAHPDPPKIDFPEYYQHLVLAHLVFGTFAFGLLEWEGRKKEYKKSRK